MRIAVNPGHGEHDPGAIGPTGLKEKDINLAAALKLRDALGQYEDVETLLTRDSDATGWPRDRKENALTRCRIANDWDADLYVSIHCNSAENRAAKGTEAYTSRGQGMSDLVAATILQEIAREFPGQTIRTDFSDGDPDKEASFWELIYTDMPAVLVEMAFISNPEEEKLLVDPGFQERMAGAIARGIAKHYGLTLKKQEFEDIKGHWAESLILEALSLGLVARDKKFRPEDKATRAESVALAVNLWRQLPRVIRDISREEIKKALSGEV